MKKSKTENQARKVKTKGITREQCELLSAYDGVNEMLKLWEKDGENDFVLEMKEGLRELAGKLEKTGF